MDFYQYLSALRRSWIWILALILVGVIAGGGVSLVQQKQYRSEASLFVSTDRAVSAAELAQGSAYVQNLVSSYSTLATSAMVLDPVIDELDLPMSSAALAGRITAATPSGTVIVTIAATDPDPELAQRIASATAGSLQKAVTSLSPADDDGASAVTLTQIAPAELPSAPSSPNTRLALLLGAGAGLLVGVFVAMVRWANRREAGTAGTTAGGERR
ncbi:YveK family protein [Mycetocola reblochoni]|nr:Wzz/FepE/Etk N-terminal domain-containing protein [Mycetocola reblochoni]SJN16028.1 putative tyrosine-protein kinase [Mycetocola reblochoni REB411]